MRGSPRETVREFAARRGDGQAVEQLGLSHCEPAVRADEITREIAFGVLLEHEVTGVGAVYACHDLDYTGGP